MVKSKKYVYKIYDSDGTTYIKTLPDSLVRNTPSYTVKINGGYGECTLDLNLPFDDFDEGVSIAFMNVVKIYEADMEYPSGRLIYTGFISEYRPYLKGAEQGVEVVLLGLISFLSLIYYRNGASYTVAHDTEDPAEILKAIIDYFDTKYPGLLGYDGDGTTIDTVGTDVSLTFTEDRLIEAVQTTAETAGGGWYWKVEADGQVYLKQKPATATHAFTIGKHIESLEVEKTSEDVKNDILVKYGASTATDDDAVSQGEFGLREDIVSENRAQNATTAEQIAAQRIADYKDDKVSAKLTVNAQYDIESIKAGDTCKIMNLSSGAVTFSDNMQIVSVRYEWNRATIGLEAIRGQLGTEMQKFISSASA